MSDGAHQRWHEFAAENGVNVSALLEVLGTRLLPGDTNTERADDADDELRLMISEARQLDTQRRRRTRS
ncbi:MAG: hypothetical protein R2733_04975 [Acidimicrobiales bacterium]